MLLLEKYLEIILHFIAIQLFCSLFSNVSVHCTNIIISTILLMELLCSQFVLFLNVSCIVHGNKRAISNNSNHYCSFSNLLQPQKFLCVNAELCISHAKSHQLPFRFSAQSTNNRCWPIRQRIFLITSTVSALH